MKQTKILIFSSVRIQMYGGNSQQLTFRELAKQFSKENRKDTQEQLQGHYWKGQIISLQFIICNRFVQKFYLFDYIRLHILLYKFPKYSIIYLRLYTLKFIFQILYEELYIISIHYQLIRCFQLISQIIKYILKLKIIHIDKNNIQKTMSYQTTQSKKQEFRKYLEKAGVIDNLTRALVGLYEQQDKPSNSIQFLKKNLGAPVEIDSIKLKKEVDNIKDQNIKLKKELQQYRKELESLKQQDGQ